MGKILITRHPALLEYLQEMGLVQAGTPVIAHASAGDVKGKDVFGVLPLHLAAVANSVTEVTLDIPAEKRGCELTLAEVKTYSRGISTYKVEVSG